jgi:cell division protease FtsH
VRNLFAQAASHRPALSSTNWTLGKRVGANPLVGHDEREQTLNQLLVEMDGDSRRG